MPLNRRELLSRSAPAGAGVVQDPGILLAITGPWTGDDGGDD
ncbi:hypothetical protein [Streptomyces sp. SA15]|nr:hypothetical protein [Streptomyces sp. SA15]